ncbi:MAG: alpha-2-macroglobulin [Planctomycetia bacterium]|nr:alpha-2-macroglobulin [Planctomycetia bacterium]
MTKRTSTTIAVIGMLSVWCLTSLLGTAQLVNRKTVEQLFRDGNYQEAYVGLRQRCLDPATEQREVVSDLQLAVQSLQQLGRIDGIDELIESTIAAHRQNWRLLLTAAQQYQSLTPYGFVIAGEFERGPHRGGGKQVFSGERDRVRSLQLMVEAMTLADQDPAKPEVAQFYLSFSDMMLQSQSGSQAWRLQSLTDLSELPDYEEGHYYRDNARGAPVDVDDNPVFHQEPTSWGTATSDGQRWRWCLHMAVEANPSLKSGVASRQADFLYQQFGVQTMQQFFSPRAFDDNEDTPQTYALHTLKENETIAKLATGVKRFELPDEFNFIKKFQDLAAEQAKGNSEQALDRLAEIFENRRQYPRAAEYWRESIRRYGVGPNRWKQDRLDQILKNWGQFEAISTQPAGLGATVEFAFRNATQVDFEAHEVDVEKMLTDVKTHLRSNPRQIDNEVYNIENIGWRIVQENQRKYLKQRVATWQEKLEPRASHFDKRITITTPLKKAGAYLVTAKVAGGNTSHILLWVADTAIVQKQLSGKEFYFVADAVTGEPVAGANVEFFGWKQEPTQDPRRFNVLTKNFAERTDDEGQIVPDQLDVEGGYQWLVVARTNTGRLAYLGFRNVWANRYYDAQYNEVKAFGITDRPVYRPGHEVKFKFWVRHAQYDKADVSQFAGQDFAVELRNPKHEVVQSWSMKADQYGGLEGNYAVPSDATLGSYSLSVVGHQAIGFRVEEYKKPEFEVTIDAPDKPIQLGEKITAKINARYYFGAPVTNATVKYKVLRTKHSQNWYPVRPWDWCYGQGYWWFSYDYLWYPGWSTWAGCFRPMPWWWHGGYDPPEVVTEREVQIGADGTVNVELDTELAKAIHGDSDHKYSITAEVRDESRRTIVGQGNVLVARQPFKVFTWVDRGYFRVGDTIQAHFLAQTLDNRPVPGAGTATLYKIGYDANSQPIETEVQSWPLHTGDDGRAELKLDATAKGQYRLASKITDDSGHTIEGGYLFTVIGEGFDGRDYRFNSLELVPDKAEYRAGETVKLQINTDRIGSTVLLFVRPANGVYLPPKLLRLRGKSTIEEIAVVKKDMPNFFVEAVTIADGDVYSEAKEIVVPPEERILNIEVLPSAETYKPGAKASVKLHVTEANGKDFYGSTVVSIYDKSLEYISGGSNVGDIKEFFWKWRRQHQPFQQTSLERYITNLPGRDQKTMNFLGIFGNTVADEEGAVLLNKGLSRGRSDRGGATMLGVMEQRAMPMAAAAMEADLVDLDAAAEGEAPDGGGISQLVSPTVRTNFADTALWVGTLDTDAKGYAEVALAMPENLTTWKINVWGIGHGTKVGSGEAEVITQKDLIIRLQAPRFFVEKDEVVLSANVHNYLANEKRVSVELELPTNELEPSTDKVAHVTIPAGGEQRVDWRVRVLREGTTTIRMKALTDEESDAVEMRFPCHVHGMLKTESWAGTVRPSEDNAQVTIRVPSERRVEQSVLEVRYSPTLAGAMVDALPYLAEYPYGCTEQTLNRFLPSVVTQNVLLDMKLDLDAIRDKRTNLNAQEIGDDRERAAQWKRFDRNPVFERAELERMVKEGVTKLTNMQLGDGGWGWFSGFGERSYPHTTAVVVHGLQLATQNDVAIVPGVLENGIAWLNRYQAEELQKLKNGSLDKKPEKKPWKQHADNLDAFVYMVLVDAGQDDQAMRDFLYRDREHLAVYSKAMFGLALHKLGDAEKLTMIARNIEQYLVQDAENETAYLKLPADNYWWHWYGSETEANAYYLKLLTRIDPQGVAAPRLVKYLLNNRKHATYWNSTRDTAVCVEAFAEYIRASGETSPDLTVEVWVDRVKQQEVRITSDNLFTFDNKFLLTGKAVTDGEHVVELRRRGKGPVYFNAYLTNFTLEDYIKQAGLEVRVDRKFYKLEPVDKQTEVAGSRGQVTQQRVEKFKRLPLADLAMLKSGDLVEVELEIESKNDYEYIIFEDMKAAGFEPVDVRSGYTNNGLGAYTEFRDDRVSFFLRQLARGRNSVSYRVRAEIPGRFSALPARAYAMYAPELKGNSDEIKLQIED